MRVPPRLLLPRGSGRLSSPALTTAPEEQWREPLPPCMKSSRCAKPSTTSAVRPRKAQSFGPGARFASKRSGQYVRARLDA